MNSALPESVLMFKLGESENLGLGAVVEWQWRKQNKTQLHMNNCLLT